MTSLIFYFAFEFSPGSIFMLKLALDTVFINPVFVQAQHLLTVLKKNSIKF